MGLKWNKICPPLLSNATSLELIGERSDWRAHGMKPAQITWNKPLSVKQCSSGISELSKIPWEKQQAKYITTVFKGTERCNWCIYQRLFAGDWQFEFYLNCYKFDVVVFESMILCQQKWNTSQDLSPEINPPPPPFCFVFFSPCLSPLPQAESENSSELYLVTEKNTWKRLLLSWVNHQNTAM